MAARRVGERLRALRDCVPGPLPGPCMDIARLPRQRRIPGYLTEECPWAWIRVEPRVRACELISVCTRVWELDLAQAPGTLLERTTKRRAWQSECLRERHAYMDERAGRVRNLARHEAALRPNWRPPRGSIQPAVQISAPDRRRPKILSNQSPNGPAKSELVHVRVSIAHLRATEPRPRLLGNEEYPH
jgi:hypothetical protein